MRSGLLTCAVMTAVSMGACAAAPEDDAAPSVDNPASALPPADLPVFSMREMERQSAPAFHTQQTYTGIA